MAAGGFCFAGGRLNASEPLRVMTFNIRYGTANDGENAWPKRKEAVVETIRRFDPDVLGVQEALAFQLDYLQQELPGYELVGVGRDDGKRRGEFAALLLRKERLKVESSGTKWLSDTPDKPGSKTWQASLPRVYTFAKVRDRQNDRELYLVTTHWDHQSQVSRVKSAEAILSHLASHAKQLPVLLMGDMNAGSDNPAVKKLLDKQTGLVDTFRTANPDAKRIGTFNGFRGDKHSAQIDWVLASGQWKVESAGVTTDAIARSVSFRPFSGLGRALA